MQSLFMPFNTYKLSAVKSAFGLMLSWALLPPPPATAMGGCLAFFAHVDALGVGGCEIVK